jgi:hypothetical protein
MKTKHSISRFSKHIFYLLLAVGLFSCTQKTEINCKYQGGIIMQVDYLGLKMGKRYTIKHEGKLYKAFPYQIDDYRVGDTINKPCR